MIAGGGVTPDRDLAEIVLATGVTWVNGISSHDLARALVAARDERDRLRDALREICAYQAVEDENWEG